MLRNGELHVGFPIGEVAYEQDRVVFVIPQECEMSVLVKTVRREVAVAKVICRTLCNGKIR